MTAPLILCIGEAMVELSQAKGDLWSLGIAGDTLNTAWYLRRCLGAEWRIAYFSRVGTGDFSQKMLQFLAAEGIEAEHVSQDPQREIGLYAISLKNGERSFSYWRGQSAARGLADDPQRLAQALATCQFAYLSGITLAILPAQGRADLLAEIARAKAAGCRIVFDPNLRPRLWQDADDMRRWIEQAAAGADLVLPSFDDENTYFGDAQPQDTATRYLGLGAGQVVVKNGGGPVYYAGPEGAGLISGLPRVSPVDSTAAGDSFNAGYLAACLQGADPAEAIRAAHELSLQVVSHPGALVREATFNLRRQA